MVMKGSKLHRSKESDTHTKKKSDETKGRENEAENRANAPNLSDNSRNSFGGSLHLFSISFVGAEEVLSGGKARRLRESFSYVTTRMAEDSVFIFYYLG